MNSQPGVIKFECPHCRAHLKTAESNAGKQVTCSKCRKTLTVPAQLSELDVVFDETAVEHKLAAADKEENQFDIDFGFSDDIEEVLARAKEKPPEPSPLPAPTAAKKTDETPPRPRMVISDENLPHKKKSQKEIVKRLERETANSDREKTDSDSSAKPAPFVIGDDDQDDEELLSQVESIELPTADISRDRLPAEEDTSPIRIEGITDDLVDVDDLYGVKCQICDTRIHVTREQVDTTVECPVCFSKVKVTPPKKASKNRPDWMGPQPGFVTKVSDSGDELKLSDPIERAKPEYIVEPDHGLPNVERDLLAPLPTDDEPDSPITEDKIETSELRIADEKPNVPAARRPTRESRPAKASRPPGPPRQPKSEKPGGGNEPIDSSNRNAETKQKPSLRERFEDSIDEDEAQKPLSVHTAENLKPLTFKALTELVTSAVIDMRVIWRAAIAIVLLTIGGYVFYLFEGTIGDDREPGFTGALAVMFYGSLYLFVYGLATVWLWYTCSFIFRDTARGFNRVESFKTRGYDEVKSTFLLFAVSFAIAGSPFLVLKSYVSAPLRLLIAPLLLIVAWYNQWPFIGISFEPFRTFRTETSDWKHFYIYVLGLAFASVLAGFFFILPYCEFIGATIMVFAALAFAAVTGWHCGRMVKKLEDE